MIMRKKKEARIFFEGDDRKHAREYCYYSYNILV